MSTAESSGMTPSLWNFGEEAGEVAKKKKSGGRHGTVNQDGGQRKRSEEVLRI